MAILKVERIGGLAGFGNPGAHVRSRGRIDLENLPEPTRQLVDRLFATGAVARGSASADAFSYRISRATNAGTETVEVPESALPAVIVGCVRDELA